MAKFLNKKEQVIDFKLTNYGHYLLSNGSFKPTYYAFIDDNIVYDSAYFNRATEKQNDIQKRIKEETQYLESLVLFEEVSAYNSPDTEINFFQSDITPTQKVPRIDEFRLNLLIGDSYVGENKQKVPSWKVISLRSDISSSVLIDTDKNTLVPQINIVANYRKTIVDREEYTNRTFNTSDDRELESVSKTFADDKVIHLEMSEPLIYIEEVNTEVLNENFDIEVFEVQEGSTSSGESLIKKYFQNKESQIIDGFMVMPNPINYTVSEMSDDAIEKLFSVFVDGEIDADTACKLASEFNKEAFLIDLDFDCNEIVREDIFFDIYGSETEAEICQT